MEILEGSFAVTDYGAQDGPGGKWNQKIVCNQRIGDLMYQNNEQVQVVEVGATENIF